MRKGRDCSGHGTHIASVAVGATNGVANKGTIYSVRVLDCSNRAPWSVIIDGLNYAGEQSLKEHQRRLLILMPLQGAISTALDTSLNRIINGNIPVVVAAGNNYHHGNDACHYSPASHPGVITVGSSTKQDNVYNDSNVGHCVDVYAPGELITGANYSCTGCKCTSIVSGTSVSAALVAGVVALYLQANTSLSPTQIKKQLTSTCIKDTTHSTARFSFNFTAPNCLLFISSKYSIIIVSI